MAMNITPQQLTYLATQDQFRGLTNMNYEVKGNNFLFNNNTVDNTTDDVEISQADLDALIARMPATEEAQAAAPAAPAANTAQLEEELAAKRAQKEENDTKIAELETQIADLQTKIQEKIEEAMKDADKIADEQKAAMSKASEAILESYIKGEINYDEMRSQMAAGFADISSEFGAQFAEKVETMMNASADMAVLRSNIDEMTALIASNKTLDSEIADCEQQIESAKAAEAAAAAPKSCDPIGFEKDGVKYDFFIDKDGDNALSNEQEFLGAGGGTDRDAAWKEMSDLDTDGNSTVSAQELEAAGVKVAVTVDGKTEMKSVTELGIDNIDLNSYKATNSDAKDANGNITWGNFGLTMGGQQVEDAYHTLDDINYLRNTYEFSKPETVGQAFGALTAAPEQTIEEKLAAYEAQYNELNAKLEAGWATLGFQGTIMDTLKSAAKIKAEQDGRIAKQGVDAEQAEVNRKEEAVTALKAAGVEYDENMTADELETLLKKEPVQEEAMAA